MHMIMMTAAGLLLLALTFGLSRWMRRSFRALLPLFLIVWFVCAIVNMWIGVTQAGYTVLQELPITAVIFGVPALVAIFLARKR